MPSVERSAADAPWDLQNPLFTHAMYQGRSA
jgi:hypothetical protein